jgi:glutamate-5-semialdehyde dehydrogenase
VGVNSVFAEVMESWETEIRNQAIKARQAARELACVSSSDKDRVLSSLAASLRHSVDKILEANQTDLAAGHEAGLAPAMMDRLELNPKRIEAMAAGVEAIASLPDPVGEELEKLSPPSGIDIRKVRVPLGVIGIIYESRPNVTIDCAALCLKAGNACILRGGKEAIQTNRVLAAIITEVLHAESFPLAAVQLIGTTDRSAMLYLLKQDEFIDCIIPRGGEGLIRFVAEHSAVPVLKHYKGVCSLYLDDEADEAMALDLVINAKTQRPGVCNAIENLYLHESLLPDVWPRLAKSLQQAGVILRLAPELRAASLNLGLDPLPETATEEDFHTEYLDLRLAVRSVASLDEAIAVTNQYSSSHSDGIVTRNESKARRYLQAVDSATVYWNASTRFTDGFEFGFGAEIGISTDHLHARGPVGLKELTTYKYLIFGTGQIRR